MPGDSELLPPFLGHNVKVILKSGAEISGLLAYVKGQELLVEDGVMTYWLPLDQVVMVVTNEDLHDDA